MRISPFRIIIMQKQSVWTVCYGSRFWPCRVASFVQYRFVAMALCQSQVSKIDHLLHSSKMLVVTN